MKTGAAANGRSGQLGKLSEDLPRLATKLGAALWPPNLVVLARNAAAVSRTAPWTDYFAADRQKLDEAADAALAWLCHSQDRVGSGGVGSYELHGFTTGYPEVTGYIIPTMWDYRDVLGREELAERAIRMADWELRIQRPGGGWEGGNEGDGEPPVVFNTGQVVRGLTRTYLETSDERYLDAAVRGANWIVANQDADGSWTAANYRQMKRVYDTYVAAPLARLATLTGNDAYAEAARRNCEFALGRQRATGWFELCDNSPYFNDAPSTHTLCYTTDGLLETGELLGEEQFVSAGLRAARALSACVDRTGRLPGRLDETWQPRASWVCLTGSAQLGIVLARWDVVPVAAEVVRRLVDFLLYVQDLNRGGRSRTGALPGSFPIWGTYAPLRYPCWATKYLLDLLRLVKLAESGRATPASSPTVGS